MAGPRSAWTSTGCRPPNATSATTAAGSARSRPLPGHRVQLDVKFIAPLAGSRRKHDQFTPSTTAPAWGSCASTPAQQADGDTVRRLRAGAAAVPGRGHRRPTTALNSSPCSTITSWTRASATTTSNRGHRGATARWSARTRIDAEEFYQLLDGVVIHDAKVVNDKLREWENFYNYHRPTAAWAARRPLKDSSSAPRPGWKRSSSVAQPREDIPEPLSAIGADWLVGCDDPSS
jgi:hypothetical protein